MTLITNVKLFAYLTYCFNDYNIKKLYNSNKIDLLNFLTYLKQKINIEKQICSSEGRNEAFESFYDLLDHF